MNTAELKPFVPLIKIFGVGGGGNNAINSMIEAGLHGADFIGINTDAQALSGCRAEVRIAIGRELTQGLGAGNDPAIGMKAAKASRREILTALEGADLVFVTAGKGGGTGTGAAPVVAEAAMSTGALTVGVVTRPFTFEGKRRWAQAEDGIERLQEEVDTLVVIPNDRLLGIAEGIPVVDAFRAADDVLRQAVQAITELITDQGLINVDFANIRQILRGSGNALIGIGSSTGEDRARQAAINAIDSPLLESSIDGARRVLLNISGGRDLALYETTEVAEVIAGAVDPEANIVFGAVIDERLDNQVKVTVIASGFRQPSEARMAGSRAEKAASERPGSRAEKPALEKHARLASADEVDVPTFLRGR